MPLYHYQIGFPATLTIPRFRECISLSYTRHAKQAARDELIDLSILPRSTVLSRTKIIEVETDKNGDCRKLVCRMPFNRLWDIVLVLLMDGTVKTLWLNSVADNHPTLNHSRYTRP